MFERGRFFVSTGAGFLLSNSITIAGYVFLKIFISEAVLRCRFQETWA